jgi:hypothetical protein
VLRGWVNYFAVGHAGECFRYIKKLGGEEGPAPYAAGSETKGLRLEAME